MEKNILSKPYTAQQSQLEHHDQIVSQPPTAPHDVAEVLEALTSGSRALLGISPILLPD